MKDMINKVFNEDCLETMKRIYGSLLICAGLLLFAKEAIRQF